jgi:hypothetical protein
MKTLYWVDDTHDEGKPPNAAAQKRLESGLRVKLQIEKIKDREQFDKLLPTIIGAETCGVIMDYQLTKVGESGQMAFGTTWAAEIRAAQPTVPVIGISHERERDIPKLRLESFLAFFQRDQLLGANPPIRNISALLKGYGQACKAKQRQKSTTGVELMVKLTKPPATVKNLVRSAIPQALRGEWDAETPHVAGRWLWHELQGMPGFLFDELGLATHLGLNLKGLQLVCQCFGDARYQGAFASDERPRWWIAAIRGIVEQIVGQQLVGSIANAREEFLRAAKTKSTDLRSLLSRPHGHKNSEAIPDCVAYEDDEREEDHRVQALFEDTFVDDRDANAAFGFEPRRVYGPQKKK